MKIFKKIFCICLVLSLCLIPAILSGCANKTEAKIEIHQTFKTEYLVGEELNINNGIIKYTDSDNNVSYINITENMVSSFNTLTSGTRDMVITYNNSTLLVSYTVNLLDANFTSFYYSYIVEGLSGPQRPMFFAFKFINDGTSIQYLILPADTSLLDITFDNAITLNGTKTIKNNQFVYEFTSYEQIFKQTWTYTVVSENKIIVSLIYDMLEPIEPIVFETNLY